MTNLAQNLYHSSISLTEFDEASLKQAKELFNEYQLKGIIRKDVSFEDDAWHMTDEYKNVGLHFLFDPEKYAEFNKLTFVSLDEFLSYVKVFMTTLFGNISLSGIRDTLLDIRHIVMNVDAVLSMSQDISVLAPMRCSDFFAMLPCPDSEAISSLLDSMEAYASSNLAIHSRSQRTLADYESYFEFDEIMTNFKTNITNPDLWLFYAPLYFWWKITSIIPLRPCEFLVTPRNCLSSIDGKDYLTLRRNHIKGSRRSVHYNITDDYTPVIYPIPAALAAELREYIKLTAKQKPTDIDTLFIQDAHYKHWYRSTPSNSRYLTHVNLHTVLMYFYKNIIQDQYGYTIISSEERHLKAREIGMIHLGDTRHLAMVNLMQSGGTIASAMALAGHSSPEMSAHYYTNLRKMIECRTYREHQRLLAGNVAYSISPSLPSLHHFDNGLNINGGYCFSAAFKSGEITDCIKNSGAHGEIGVCTSCPFFRSPQSTSHVEQDLQRSIDLYQLALSRYRSGIGLESDLGEALLLLQHDAYSYESFCREQLLKEMPKNAAKKRN